MRTVLEVNHELVLPVASGTRSYWIDGVMGDGATSIVYKAHYYDNGGSSHDVIIKECFPYASKTFREGAALIWENPEEQVSALDAFHAAHKKLSAIHALTKLKNSTSAAMELCGANGTLYSVQHLYAGITYDKDAPKRLEDILETTLALTKVIAEYHNQGLLHLDIKPENFMVIPETRQMVILFDVDTVTAIQDIDAGLVDAVPSSDGWAAPEQLSGKLSQICPATDLFAIGATLFSKVVGRKVTAEDMGIFAQWDFCDGIIDGANPRAIRLLRNILRKTIAASVKRRYQTAPELIEALEEAIKAVRDDMFVLSHYSPSTVQFIGREDELAKIHDHFTSGSRAVFLYGFGGMGKTELAKKYAECFSQEYDACVFQMYQPEYGLKKYIEGIQIHNAEGGDMEKQLRGVLKKSHVLLIVDNFDVDDDEYLEELWSLDADILFTTRNDFSDQASDTIRILNLDALSMGQLLVLFQRELGRPMPLEDLQAAKKIIESVDNWTMIVPIIAKQIVAAGKTVAEYAEMMEADGFRSLDNDTEEIRIRYHGKLHRKTPMGILRYVFDVGALDATELEALCNVSVLRYHKSLTKERYRYYTGVKNLNALNRIISACWVKYDSVNDILSVHPMVLELVESDIERTPDRIPGIFRYITKQFEALDKAQSVQDAQQITFALLMLTDIKVEDTEESSIYSHLAEFVARLFPLNITALYQLLFEAPAESDWHMNTSYLPAKLTIPNSAKLDLEQPIDFITDLLLKLIVRYSFMLYGKETPIRPVEITPSDADQVTNLAEAEAYIEMEKKIIDTYAIICPRSLFSPTGEIQYDADWRLQLREYPEEYPYFCFVLKSVQEMMRIAVEYNIALDEKYRTFANDLIVIIQDSLGLFAWNNLSCQQILDYAVLCGDMYQHQLTEHRGLHYTKKANTWYMSLEKAIIESADPYPIYKLILDVDYELSRSYAAVLVKNNFAAKILFDSRLSGEQKRYLSTAFCAKQVDNMRHKYCRRPTRVKGLAKTHKNHLTLYAQLLSGVELLLKDAHTWVDEQMRIDIYRAAFIIKRVISVEILDPKPHILLDIRPENIAWLAEFLELAEWTRTSGYIKQSQEMKNKLLNCCLELDYDNLPENLIQHILYKLEPLARNYKRQDVLDVLWKQKTTRRTFRIDLLDSAYLTLSQKREILHDLADEFLWEICKRYYDEAVLDSTPQHSEEFEAYRDLFIEIYPKVAALFPSQKFSWWDFCAFAVIPEVKKQKNSLDFLLNCHATLRYLIHHDDPGVFTDKTQIEGLVYLMVKEADLGILKTYLKDILEELSDATWSIEDRFPAILQNVCRIRPEVTSFLKSK